MGVGPQHCGMYGYDMGIGMPMGYVYGYEGYMYCCGHGRGGGCIPVVVVQLASTVVVVWVGVAVDNTLCL